MTQPVLLDGPVGTELIRRGVSTPPPLWSVAAIDDAPEVLEQIHRDYVAAGASVHTTNTFRTGPWMLERTAAAPDWRTLTERAVAITRRAVPSDQRVAGSMAPLEDCYRPDLRPGLADCRRAHERMARQLCDCGVDLLLCETFADPDEALTALEAALCTGLPVWLALTLGPEGDLLTPSELIETLARAAELGASAVLVNCSPSWAIEPLVADLAALSVPAGAYGTVGAPDEQVGWRCEGQDRPAPHAAIVSRWVAAGLRILGGCCGARPAHIAALRSTLG